MYLDTLYCARVWQYWRKKPLHIFFTSMQVITVLYLSRTSWVVILMGIVVDDNSPYLL